MPWFTDANPDTEPPDRLISDEDFRHELNDKSDVKVPEPLPEYVQVTEDFPAGTDEPLPEAASFLQELSNTIERRNKDTDEINFLMKQVLY